MSEKKDVQNNDVVVTTADQIPQTETKKDNMIVRLVKSGHRKILQFRATKVGRFVTGVARGAEAGLAAYGMYELFFHKKSEEPAEEVVISSGEIVEDKKSYEDQAQELRDTVEEIIEENRPD